MPIKVHLDVLNLACCAIEASRGVNLWREQAIQSGLCDEVMVSSDVQPSEEGFEPDLSILVVAGTVTNSQLGLVQTRYESLGPRRAVVAFGVCTISGGPYWDSYSVAPGISEVVPVDVMLAGCPPLPIDLARALDSLVSKVESAHV